MTIGSTTELETGRDYIRSWGSEPGEQQARKLIAATCSGPKWVCCIQFICGTKWSRNESISSATGDRGGGGVANERTLPTSVRSRRQMRSMLDGALNTEWLNLSLYFSGTSAFDLWRWLLSFVVLNRIFLGNDYSVYLGQCIFKRYSDESTCV